MKTFSLLLVVAGSLAVLPVFAQPFSISSHVIGGGGGVSSGGGFQVVGTIGQPDAAPRLASGCWSVDPGFWGAYAAVQTPGAPALRIRVEGDDVLVSFTPTCEDWVLQFATELMIGPIPTDWRDDPFGGPILVGDEMVRRFHTPSWGPRLFFRLRKP